MDDAEIYGADAPLIDLAEFPSWILFEDVDLLVINKPGWVVCHPSKNGPLSSLVGAAREYTKLDMLHLVSRLDRETSGIVILGKTKPTSRKMQISFEQRMVNKTYLTILHGEMKGTLEVSKPLGPDPASPVAVKQHIVKDFSGQKAQTTFIPLITRNGYTFARAQPHTGRKHQIRAHALYSRHGVVGDKLYGADETLYLEFCEQGWTPRLAAALPMQRQALHAWRVEFLSETLPTYIAPLPKDFRDFLRDKVGVSDEELQQHLETLERPRN
ncbi:MAG: RluA family pseudouridine synthase [Verrucomicrobiota bacterium]|nr:RluA family pseudouridine synthase [Verrucomicrobiota bacterium]